jgi:hypothetical protein
MTVPKHTSNSPSCRNPIGIGKSTANDGDDDELRTFSKGVAALFLKMIDAVKGWKYRSTSATNSDAGVKLGVPTSSRTSSAARVELPIPLFKIEWVFIHIPHPRSDPQDLGEHEYSTRTSRSRWQ